MSIEPRRTVPPHSSGTNGNSERGQTQKQRLPHLSSEPSGRVTRLISSQVTLKSILRVSNLPPFGTFPTNVIELAVGWLPYRKKTESGPELCGLHFWVLVPCLVDLDQNHPEIPDWYFEPNFTDGMINNNNLFSKITRWRKKGPRLSMNEEWRRNILKNRDDRLVVMNNLIFNCKCVRVFVCNPDFLLNKSSNSSWCCKNVWDVSLLSLLLLTLLLSRPINQSIDRSYL